MMFRNRNFRVLTWIYLASTARLRLYIMYIGLLGHLYTSDGTLPTNIIRIALCSIKRRPLDDKYWIYWIILWPPCVADTDIIFSSCGFFFCFFFLSFSFFFSRLFSAVAKWMSAILAHMVWPECEFRMQVWDVLHAARWKYRTQKIAKNSPSGHHRTTLSGYVFASEACIENRKNLQYLLQMSPEYGELLPNGWDLLASLGHPCEF